MAKDDLANLLTELEARLGREGATPEAKREFWKLVSRAKRLHSPPEDVVERAARLRELLFSPERIYPLRPVTAVFASVFAAGWATLALDEAGTFGGGLMGEWALPALTVILIGMGAYPLGAVVASRASGIRLMGYYMPPPGSMVRDPTLWLNFASYLRAGPLRARYFAITGTWAVCWFWAAAMAGALAGAPGGLLTAAAMTGLLAVFTLRGGGQLHHWWRERRINREKKA